MKLSKENFVEVLEQRVLPLFRALVDDLESRYPVSGNVWSHSLGARTALDGHTLGMEVHCQGQGYPGRVTFILDFHKIHTRPNIARCTLDWCVSHDAWPRHLVSQGTVLSGRSWRKLGRAVRIALESMEPILLRPPKSLHPSNILTRSRVSPGKTEPEYKTLESNAPDYQIWSRVLDRLADGPQAKPGTWLIAPVTYPLASTPFLNDPDTLFHALSRLDSSLRRETVISLYHRSHRAYGLVDNFNTKAPYKFADIEEPAGAAGYHSEFRPVFASFPEAQAWLYLVRVGESSGQSVCLYYDTFTSLSDQPTTWLWAAISHHRGGRWQTRLYALDFRVFLGQPDLASSPTRMLRSGLEEVDVPGIRRARLLADDPSGSYADLEVVFEDGQTQIFTLSVAHSELEVSCPPGVLLVANNIYVPEILEACVRWKTAT